MELLAVLCNCYNGNMLYKYNNNNMYTDGYIYTDFARSILSLDRAEVKVATAINSSD